MPRIFDKYEKKARRILADNWAGGHTVPAAGLYPHQWNWDSGFIAIGRAHYDPAGAMTELTSLFAAQWKNGMLPQIVFDPRALGSYFPEPDFWQTERSPNAPDDRLTSGITMPPVHAIAAERILEATGSRKGVMEFLEGLFRPLTDLHRYLYRERDPDQDGLVYIRHPWESGIDNSPTWDEPLSRMTVRREELPDYRRLDLDHVPEAMRPSERDYDRYVYLVDLFRQEDYDERRIYDRCPFLILDPLFNAILCRANQSLIRVAETLGKSVGELRDWEEATRHGIGTRLWCPKKKNFNAVDLTTDRFIYVDTAAGFLPLFAGAASREQARILYERLDSVSFCSLHQGNCYTVPNYDTRGERFDRSNYWRGPVWININWMLAQGLSRYGYTLKADSLRRDLLQLPIRFGFREYFDSFTGQGYGSDGFSWTAALFIDLVHGFYNETDPSRPLDGIRGFLLPPAVLNRGGRPPTCRPPALAAELMKSIHAMKEAFYDTERGLIDYQALRDSPQFRQYRDLTIGLKSLQPGMLASDAERLAFWINLYNTIVIDGIVSLGVQRSVREVPGFLRRIGYRVGKQTFSAEDIEHGVLRGNARRPGWPFRQLTMAASKRRWIVGRTDPRIHFGLVCGSRSCPPIDFYDPDRIEDQLDNAARSFVNSSEVIVFPEENRVLLSEIFRWYAGDFGGRQGVIDLLVRYLTDGDGREFLTDRGAEARFEYLFYDWDLNRWGK